MNGDDDRPRSSLDVQAKEARLIHDERAEHIRILENRRKDPVPVEVIELKRARLQILDDICHTVERAAEARSRFKRR